MIWLAIAALLLITFLALLPAFLSGNETAFASPLDHYKEQLEELDKDIARGMISGEDAATARLEIERRILKAAAQRDAASDHGTASNSLKGITIALLLFLTAGATVFYMVTGRPDLPAAVPQITLAAEQRISEDGPTFAAAIETIKSRLATNPDDIQGWAMLATTARGMQDYGQAAAIYSHLVEKQPQHTPWKVALAENLIAMASGKVTPAANLALDDVLRADSMHPAAHFYKGLGFKQAGDNDRALNVWQALAERSDPNAPWMRLIKRNIADLKNPMPVITADQAQAVEAMSPEEQAEFFRVMTQRLTDRLAADPDNARGWAMLARTHLTLGDEPAAIAVLKAGISKVSEKDGAQLKAMLDSIGKDK